MKRILLLFISLSCAANVFAQKTLYLKPFIGGQNPYCSYVKGTGKSEFTTINRFNLTDNYGVLFELPLDEKWAVAAGLSKGNIGWSFKVEVPQSVMYSHLIVTSYSRSNYIHRFPLLVKYNVSGKGWKEIDAAKKLYRYKFKFYTQAGLSIDYLSPRSEFLEKDTSGWVTPSNEYITNYEFTKVLHRWNSSVIVGIGTQFYYNGKPKFDLTFFYSQGLRKMLQVDIETETNGLRFDTHLVSRGTVLGANLAFPIKLKSFEKHTEDLVN